MKRVLCTKIRLKKQKQRNLNHTVEIPFDPAIPLLGIYPKDYKSFYYKMYVHSGTVYNSKDMEPTQMPTNDRPDRENVAHIHHGILCSHKQQ